MCRSHHTGAIKRRHVQQYVFFSVVLVKVSPDLLNVGVKLHDGGADGPED